MLQHICVLLYTCEHLKMYVQCQERDEKVCVVMIWTGNACKMGKMA